jgi:hypothetical protein
MVDMKEQRFCIKFCFKLVQCMKAHKYLYRRKATTGLTGLKMAENQMTKTKVLDELHLAQRWKMLQECASLHTRTVGELSVTFTTLWDCHTGYDSVFCRRNST